MLKPCCWENVALVSPGQNFVIGDCIVVLQKVSERKGGLAADRGGVVMSIKVILFCRRPHEELQHLQQVFGIATGGPNHFSGNGFEPGLAQRSQLFGSQGIRSACDKFGDGHAPISSTLVTRASGPQNPKKDFALS